MVILIQFVFRVALGMAAAMAVTPARLVTSGYFRVHLWVILGLATLGTLAATARPGHLASSEHPRLWMVVAATAAAVALASYVGAVLWLYEATRAGKVALWIVAAVALAGAVLATDCARFPSPAGKILAGADILSGGLLLGATLAAMFLGHWYLNTPTMELAPLRRLVMLLAGAVLVRMTICGLGLILGWQFGTLRPGIAAFVALRWLAGLAGTLTMAAMTWQTLKIPNTQSATGILYVAVILAFIGELASLLLSAGEAFPL